MYKHNARKYKLRMTSRVSRSSLLSLARYSEQSKIAEGISPMARGLLCFVNNNYNDLNSAAWKVCNYIEQDNTHCIKLQKTNGSNAAIYYDGKILAYEVMS